MTSAPLRDRLAVAFSGPVAELNTYWCNGIRWCGGLWQEPPPEPVDAHALAYGCDPTYKDEKWPCACRTACYDMADKAIAITSSPPPSVDPRLPRGDADDDGA